MFLVALVGLESWHLIRHGASFAEHFYGLHRVVFKPEWSSLAITRQGMVVQTEGERVDEAKFESARNVRRTLI